MFNKIIPIFTALFICSSPIIAEESPTLSLNKGQTFQTTYQTKSQVDQPVEINTSTTYTIKSEAKEVSNNKIILDNLLTNYQMTVKQDGSTISYDSSLDKNDIHPTLLATIDYALAGSITQTLSPKGELLDTEVKLNKVENKHGLPSSEFAAIGQGGTQILHEMAHLTQYATYPDKTIKVGDSWTFEREREQEKMLPQLVSEKIKSTYTLRERDDEKSIIDFTTTVEGTGVYWSFEIDVKEIREGTLQVDHSTGLPIKGSYTLTKNTSPSNDIRGESIPATSSKHDVSFEVKL